MSNEINTKIKEDIASDVCEMAREDIWNVIFAIEKEFGIGKLPYTKDNDTFIDIGHHQGTRKTNKEA